MKLVGLEHVQLAMPAGGEEAARAFYTGVLGVPEVAKPPRLAKRGGCWFEQAGLKLHVGVDADFRPARKAHPAILVEDLARVIAHLQVHGLQLVRDQTLDGYDRGYVNDPFGNRIELMQLLERP